MLCMERKTVPDHEVAMRAVANIAENDDQKMYMINWIIQNFSLSGEQFKHHSTRSELRQVS